MLFFQDYSLNLNISNMIICNCRNLSSSSSQMFTMTLQRGIVSLSPSSSRLLKLETSSSQLSRRTLLSFKSEASLLRQQRREADAAVASADEVEARLASLAAILRANELLDSGSETKNIQRPESDSGPSSILKDKPKENSSSAPTTQLKEDSSAPTVKLNGGSSSASTAPLREDSSSAPTIQQKEDSSSAPTIQLREDSSSVSTIQLREDSSCASSAPQPRKDSALPLK
jgi:hypothetical protein